MFRKVTPVSIQYIDMKHYLFRCLLTMAVGLIQVYGYSWVVLVGIFILFKVCHIFQTACTLLFKDLLAKFA